MCVLALAGCAKKHNAHVPPVRLPYTPMSGETGLASWYGHPYNGRPAADGEIYDMETMVAAHRTLPFGTLVRVTNLANARTVDVRIIDRGPFIEGRIIDLSHAAAERIDLVGPGVAQVRLDILSTPPAGEGATQFAVQVGAFADRGRADQIRSAMEQRYGSARLGLRHGSPPLWRVLVGQETNLDSAHQLAQHLEGEVDHCFVVRLDDATRAAGQ